MMGEGEFNSSFSFKTTAADDRKKRWKSPCLVVRCTVTCKGLGRRLTNSSPPGSRTSFAGGGGGQGPTPALTERRHGTERGLLGSRAAILARFVRGGEEGGCIFIPIFEQISPLVIFFSDLSL